MDSKENRAEQMLQEYVARERGRSVKVHLWGAEETLNRPKPRTLHFNLAKAVSCAAAAAIPVILGAMKESLGSLAATVPVLGVIWVVCGILMIIVSKTSYQKDYDKINSTK